MCKVNKPRQILIQNGVLKGFFTGALRQKSVICNLIFLSLFIFLSAPTLYAQNLITNGSFGNQGTNWTFFPPATTTEAWGSESIYGGVSTTNTVAEIDYGADLRQTNIPVIPGQTYWLSFRHSRRTAGGAPNPVSCEVKIYNGSTNFLDQTLTSTNTSWNWQCETFQFTPTTNTVSIDFGSVNNTSTLGMIVDDITITPVNQPIDLNGVACQGSSITLDAPNFPNDPDAVYSNYSWSGPGGALTSTTSSIALTNLQASDAGAYTCTMTMNGCLTVTGTYNLTVSLTTFSITDSICEGDVYSFYGRQLQNSGVYDTIIPAGNNGCDSSITLTLKVIPNPLVQITPSGNVSICQGDTILVKLDSFENDVAYKWYQNGSPISGATGTSINVTGAGIYYLFGNRKGCTTRSQNLSVTLYPSPTAHIQTVPGDLCAFDTLTLTAFYDPDYQYKWEPESVFSDFLPGQKNGSVLTGTFKDPSTQVNLKVTNQYGCVAEDSIMVTTKPCCEVFVPSAFTPNNDGKNDSFIPVLRGGQKIKTFQIFNRYGQIIYSYATGKIGWDGDFNGKAVDVGIYFYNLVYQCSDGQVYNRKGSITLVR